MAKEKAGTTTAKKRRIRKKRRREMVIHRYRYYEARKFFEPCFVVELSFHVFSKHNTVLHVEVVRKIYKENKDKRMYYECHTDKYFANARRYLKLINEIDKINKNDFEKVKKLFNFDD
ncbi:MAG: hypothetical protein JHC31_00165 [Sulfurihydrogenibium sp.]|nr:hypothetical protein [Sulfurihydrogenibium sp.]